MTVTTAHAQATMRLVSGVFYEAAQLGRGVDSLAASGFGRREMCFIGTRDALGGLHAAMSDAPRKLRLVYALSNDVEVVGTSGALLRELEKAAHRDGGSGFHSGGLLLGLFEKFSDHIRRNATVLTVRATDPATLQSGSLILLQHSAHPVQTHEFTLMHPRTGGTGAVRTND